MVGDRYNSGKCLLPADISSHESVQNKKWNIDALFGRVLLSSQYSTLTTFKSGYVLLNYFPNYNLFRTDKAFQPLITRDYFFRNCSDELHLFISNIYSSGPPCLIVFVFQWFGESFSHRNRHFQS